MNEMKSRRFHIRVSGGMGITLEGTIDSETLPDDLAQTVETELTPTRLSRVARRRATSFAPGQQEYEVTLLSGVRGSPRRYTFTDQQADPELLDLMDELAAFIIRDRMKARKAAREQDEAESVTVLEETTTEQLTLLSGPAQAQDRDLGPGEEADRGRDDPDAATDKNLTP
jgi:hypothetical protein